jgi:hypothetical protein
MLELGQLLSTAQTSQVSRLEYRTKNELLTSAYFFIQPRDTKRLDLEVFAALYLAQLCFFEEWQPETLTETDFALIDQNFLQPQVKSIVEISHLEAVQKVNQITALFLEHFRQYPNESEGIFCNQERAEHRHLEVTDILSSVVFFDQWNHLEVLFKTKTDFLYFSWATGA